MDLNKNYKKDILELGIQILKKNKNNNKKVEMFKDYPDVVTVPQVMEMLHVGKTKTYRLLKTGQIKSKKDESGYYIIPKIAVIDYVLKDENQANVLSAKPFTSTRKSDMINQTVVGL